MQIFRLVILGILLAGCSSGSGSSPPIAALNTTSGRTSATMQRSASSLGLVPTRFRTSSCMPSKVRRTAKGRPALSM
jgi:hypothetical protein